MSNAENIKEKIENMLSNDKLTEKAKRDKLKDHLKEMKAITFDGVVDKDTIKDKFILIKFIEEKLEERKIDENN